jgi:hypothetical protein
VVHYRRTNSSRRDRSSKSSQPAHMRVTPEAGHVLAVHQPQKQEQEEVRANPVLQAAGQGQA